MTSWQPRDDGIRRTKLFANSLRGTGSWPAARSWMRCADALTVAESTWHRWLSQYGGMKASDAKRLKELEAEDARLKKLVANQALDIDMIKGVGGGKRLTPNRRRAQGPLRRRPGRARPKWLALQGAVGVMTCTGPTVMWWGHFRSSFPVVRSPGYVGDADACARLTLGGRRATGRYLGHAAWGARGGHASGGGDGDHPPAAGCQRADRAIC